MHSIHKKVHEFISSQTFLYLILLLFCLQALWIAFSFRYPMIFDESFHLPVVKIHSEQLAPYLSTQLPKWDEIGVISTGAHGIYHYLLSFPYRLAHQFVSSETALVIFLRVLNVAMVAVGLWLYSRLFRLAKIKQKNINVGLFLFTLLPLFVLVSAHINYDNMLFMLTPLFLIFATRLLQANNPRWSDLAWFIIIDCLASLVKFTFIPIGAIASVYVFINLYRKYGTGYISKLRTSFFADSILKRIVIITILLISLGIFSSIHIKNLIVYHSVTPACSQVISEERCSVNWIQKREVKALETKDQRNLDISSFTVAWFEKMTLLGNTGSNTTNGVRESSFPPQAIKILITFGIVFGIGGILYGWRSLPKNIAWGLLLSVSVGLVLSVYYVNLQGYISLHTQFGNQARYNMSVIPILVVMSVAAYSYILRNHRWAKYTLLTFVLLLFTQGGGVITHIVKSKDTWYWQNQRVIKANHAAKKVLKPVVLEK